MTGEASRDDTAWMYKRSGSRRSHFHPHELDALCLYNVNWNSVGSSASAAAAATWYNASPLDRGCEAEASDKGSACGKYSVCLVRGRSAGDTAEDKLPLAAQLERLRGEGATGLARDAFCALLAVMASRREMCWLEAHDGELPVRGYFAHALANPQATLRLGMANMAAAGLRPASLLVTKLVPLRQALQLMDSGGPLKELPAEALVGGKATEDFELGLQELEFSNDLGAYGTLPEERGLARDIAVLPAMKELLLSSRDVIVVDAYVSLAPRAIAAAQGLNQVVQAEFTQLLERAKAEGLGVVLQIGGNNPHMLARKVYMRPAFTQHGLRCGYLRWRATPQTAWGREQPWNQRVCIGVQLP
mmetsp:Transcript_51245/g.149077  ORF Transcript_51245/g.149077 Transcript_51245/m.149077 type:complete len:360 (+) Transcript_51245:598-1677(+)